MSSTDVSDFGRELGSRRRHSWTNVNRVSEYRFVMAFVSSCWLWFNWLLRMRLRVESGWVRVDLLTRGGMAVFTSMLGLKSMWARRIRAFIIAPICQMLEQVPLRGWKRG